MGREGQGQAQPEASQAAGTPPPTRDTEVTLHHPSLLGAETWYPLGLLLEIQTNARMSLELESTEERLTPPKAGSG